MKQLTKAALKRMSTDELKQEKERLEQIWNNNNLPTKDVIRLEVIRGELARRGGHSPAGLYCRQHARMIKEDK
ncbi:hypothetical protein LCGC14_0775560 [marine sediment metagenome]|uniref:Uncharacterized protein n=1 Tax=marine sediment metagenome TaxID=412755 RepID=A0A0F9SH53_9ZZZZ